MDKFISHILVVDDDDGIRLLVKKYLNENNFLVTTASSAEDASDKIKLIKFDLIILDIMMPGKTGLQFLKEIRQNSRVPILMLTAMSSTEDRIDGLETGADDYLSKPFQPKELLLRIKNILKRNSYISKVKPSSNLEFGPFFFNMDSLNLYKNGLSIHLTTSEQNLLKCFAKMPDKALSRDDLNKMLGGKMEDRSIDVAITRIRKKIEKDQRFPTYLQTIRGFGWKLNTFNSKELDNET